MRAAEPSDDLDSPATWLKANPSMGLTIREDRFAEEWQEAKRKPTTLSAFKRYRFDLWIAGSNPALSSEDWQACAADYTEEGLLGQECWAGLDLSRMRDMCSLALIFRGDAEGEYKLLIWFWLPRGTLEAPETPAEFRAWVEHGHLLATDGDVTDYAAIEEKLVELAGSSDGEVPRKFDVRELAYDPHYAEELTQRVADRTGVERVAFGQTHFNFAAPTSEFERLVISHKLRHNGSPVLAWQAGHVEFAVDRNNNKRPVKPGNRVIKKVDGIVAAIQALARAMQQQQGAGGSGCLVL